MLTKQEEMIGVTEVIQNEPEPSNEEQAMLAAANSGIDFSLPPEDQPNRGEIIEIIDDKDNDILDQYMKEESTQQLYKDELPKIEEGREEEDTPKETIKHDDKYGRLKQIRIANRQYQDYKLYVMVEKEDKLDNEDDPKKMVSMAHYIMMHYAKKESVKKKQKKKYKPKAGQYSLEAGLKHFGERGETAVSKELKQFNVYNVFEPLYANKLSDEEKLKALTLLIFLKEKRDRNVKAWSCANGSVQREHVAKEEAAAPTVALESVFVTATIDAKEKQKNVTIDIPGAFLHANNKDYVVMKMNGSLVELMVKTELKIYWKYMTIEKGRQVL